MPAAGFARRLIVAGLLSLGARRAPQRITLIVIHRHEVPTDEDHAWLQASRSALDHAAIAALLGTVP